MSNISILCPTRNRPNNIQALVYSAQETASEFQELEFVFYIDDDDIVSEEKIKELNLPNIKYIIGDRVVLSQMWNECYNKASADVFMHCGDDILFKSKNWDIEILNAFDLYEDKIVLVYGNDLAHGRGLSTHGFFHREWVEAVGYFCPPYFSSDWNDVWLYRMGESIKRLHYLPEVVTEHLHPTVARPGTENRLFKGPNCSFEDFNGKAEWDSTHQERVDRGKKDKVGKLFKSPEMTQKRKSDIDKLLHKMK